MCFRCSEICERVVFISQKTKKKDDDESGKNHIHRPRRKKHRNESNQRHSPNDRARFGRGSLRISLTNNGLRDEEEDSRVFFVFVVRVQQQQQLRREEERQRRAPLVLPIAQEATVGPTAKALERVLGNAFSRSGVERGQR